MKIDGFNFQLTVPQDYKPKGKKDSDPYALDVQIDAPHQEPMQRATDSGCYSTQGGCYQTDGGCYGTQNGCYGTQNGC